MSYVLLQCIKQGSKLRVKMMSSNPFIKGMNCQFPRAIREEGMYYILKSETIKLRNNFYSAIGSIVYKTFNFDEVKKYIGDICETKKIKPAIIFGEDDEIECIICLEKEKDTVFAPCGHFMTCSVCSIKCKSCPICRGKIFSMLKRNDLNKD